MLDRSPSFRPKNLDHETLPVIRNLYFALFVIGVHAFTIIDGTYRPVDPFHHSSPNSKLTSFLTDESLPNSNNSANCDPLALINCRDPEIFHLMMRTIIKKFSDDDEVDEEEERVWVAEVAQTVSIGERGEGDE